MTEFERIFSSVNFEKTFMISEIHGWWSRSISLFYKPLFFWYFQGLQKEIIACESLKSFRLCEVHRPENCFKMMIFHYAVKLQYKCLRSKCSICLRYFILAFFPTLLYWDICPASKCVFRVKNFAMPKKCEGVYSLIKTSMKDFKK